MWSKSMLTRAIHFSPVSVMPPVFVNVRVDSIAEASFSDASAMVTENYQESIRGSGLDSVWGAPVGQGGLIHSPRLRCTAGLPSQRIEAAFLRIRLETPPLGIPDPAALPAEGVPGLQDSLRARGSAPPPRPMSISSIDCICRTVSKYVFYNLYLINLNFIRCVSNVTVLYYVQLRERRL